MSERLHVFEALTASLDELIRLVEERRAELSPPVAASEPLQAARRDGTAPLTPRQREILADVADGRSTNEIATDPWLSIATVRNLIAHALAPLAAHSRVQAVAYAPQRGLLP